MAKDEASVLDVILGVATDEAVQAGYMQITTAHLLIALSRFSEGLRLTRFRCGQRSEGRIRGSGDQSAQLPPPPAGDPRTPGCQTPQEHNRSLGQLRGCA